MMETEKYDSDKTTYLNAKELDGDYVRCFGSVAGKNVLNHLRHITKERVLGPDASDVLLRHIEGQRCLVHQIEQKIIHAKRCFK